MYTDTIKEMVKDGKKAKFVKYFNNQLWYITENNFLFPVPLEDIGNATFNYEEKAIHLMRYIRKYLEVLNEEATPSVD